MPILETFVAASMRNDSLSFANHVAFVGIINTRKMLFAEVFRSLCYGEQTPQLLQSQ